MQAAHNMNFPGGTPARFDPTRVSYHELGGDFLGRRIDHRWPEEPLGLAGAGRKSSTSSVRKRPERTVGACMRNSWEVLARTLAETTFGSSDAQG